jgi:hypothetical protein
VARAYAGVTVTVRNHSRASIQNVEVYFEYGRAKIGTLQPREEWSENVGKLGEGAEFSLAFHDQGSELRATRGVYFHGLGLRHEVILTVLDDHVVRIWEDGGRAEHLKAKPTRRAP